MITLNTVKNWQTNNYNILKNKKLNSIILPGAHDAGANSNDIRLDLEAGYYENSFIKFLHNFKYFDSFLKMWSSCQNKNIYNLLLSGIRFFDLRLCKSNDGKLRLQHSFMYDTFENCLDQFIIFFKEHPKEFIKIQIRTIGCSQREMFNTIYTFMKQYKSGEFWKLTYEYHNYNYRALFNYLTYEQFYKMKYKRRNIYIIDNNQVYFSYKVPDFYNVHDAAKHAKKWLNNILNTPSFLHPKHKEENNIIYSCNITPSKTVLIISFLCYNNIVFLIICIIFIIIRFLFLINNSNKKSDTILISILKFLFDPTMIILYIIFSFYISCYIRKGFNKGIGSREPYYQNTMIDVLKNNTLYKNNKPLLSIILLDFPTYENIQYIINLNNY